MRAAATRTPRLLLPAAPTCAGAGAASWAEWWCAAHHKEHAVEARHEHLAVKAALSSALAKVTELEGQVATLRGQLLFRNPLQENPLHFINVMADTLRPVTHASRDTATKIDTLSRAR
jgi:hypothetical protein